MGFSEPKDLIPLWNFGKWEVLAKIDLLEDRFDVPMSFENLGYSSADLAKSATPLLLLGD